ncbi:Ribonuclease H [Amphibalanus amphitrite]|uniref:Ribonuclease H n=1 Tax=Amphibalanus amphitrite TaxID=1232801 RepID=A0A6A4WU96_AMPAM|nr:Ribonuclease H [Amphibalanus amphitrite]
MVGLAASLPEGDPLRTVGEAVVPRRLRTTEGWREVGLAALSAAGAKDIPVETRLHHSLPPWTDSTAVQFHLDLGPRASRAISAETRRAAAEERIRELPPEAVWVWSDGSAEGGVENGGGGALLRPPNGDDLEVRVPAGRFCSSTRAELTALLAALEAAAELPGCRGVPVVACLDSKAALLLLAGGAAAQASTLGARLWAQLRRMTADGSTVTLQWVPAHCGLAGNERADALAKEAAALPQQSTPVDVRTLTRAVARHSKRKWQADWPAGWYRTVMGDRAPAPVRTATREEAVDIHQLRSGHWARSEQYLHRIGRRPTPECAQCDDKECPAGRCLVCSEAADTPAHVLLECPCLYGPRLRALGNIIGAAHDVRRDDVVAALAAGYMAHKSRSATLPLRR